MKGVQVSAERKLEIEKQRELERKEIEDKTLLELDNPVITDQEQMRVLKNCYELLRKGAVLIIRKKKLALLSTYGALLEIRELCSMVIEKLPDSDEEE